MLDGLATIRVAVGEFAGAVQTWQEGLRLHPAAGARAGHGGQGPGCALARAHLGQADELARMRRRFGPVMRGQPAEPAFLMATAQGQHARASAAILARAGREMKSIQAWLAQP